MHLLEFRGRRIGNNRQIAFSGQPVKKSDPGFPGKAGRYAKIPEAGREGFKVP